MPPFFKKSIIYICLIVLFTGSSAKGFPHEVPFNELRIYQIMVESFQDGDPQRNYGVGYGPSRHKGDLRGVINALSYIKNLGMNAIWLTPVFDSGAGIAPDPDPKLDATGYFCRDYFKIDPKFGTMEDARQLVQKAHELGLYVFFDAVFGHHKKNVRPSPQGLLPVGPANSVKYPESLPFYKEVATYWIDELGIDGWRCDQVQQVPIDAWRELRAAVEAKCNERKKAGKKWGILGYMVGERWSVAENIAKLAYGTEDAPGLLSAFDFPLRYSLVQTLAVEEKGLGHQPASALQKGFATHKQYPAFARPNLMLTNHDLVRFGDLIERAGYRGPETGQYWQRHKAALSFMAAFTGPITIYYGDEIGAEVPDFAQKVEDECWLVGLCDDHVSRTDGRISNFSANEQELHDYVASLMKLRQQHPALWDGDRRNLFADSTLYIDVKTRGNERIVYILNVATKADTVVVRQSDVGGDTISNLLDGKTFSASDGAYRIPVQGLTGNFYMVK